MIHFLTTEADKRYLYIKTDETDEDIKNMNRLMEAVNLVPERCYMPQYKGPVYTEDFLFKYKRKSGDTVYHSSIGMWQEFYKFFKKNGIPFDGIENIQHIVKCNIGHTFDEFKEIVDSWGLKYNPRPYQYEAAYKVLSYRNSVSQIATRAGKTLIAYIIFRYAMEYLGAKNILMITPSIDLVKQAYSDFNEYQEFFNAECIWAGGKLVQSSNLTIGTFQSLIKFLDRRDKKYDPSFFDKFDMVFVDETHRATANQIKTIISQPFMKDLKYGFGLTGTLPKDSIEWFCLQSLLGAKIQEITPKQLMEDGYISNIEIHQELLEYKDIDRIDDLYIRCAEYCIGDYVLDDNKKKIELEHPEFLFKYEKKLPYIIAHAKQNLISFGTVEDKFELPSFMEEEEKCQTVPGVNPIKAQYIEILKERVANSESANALFIEKMMTHLLPERTDYITGLIRYCPGNTLILAHHVEYVKHLVAGLKERYPGRNILMVTGSVTAKKRDEVKKIMQANDNVVLVASYSCMSTGLTLPKLKYGILAESFKSNVVNMQSLGRGLGLVEGKDKYTVYDLIDKFPTMKIQLQGRAKRKIYEENNYEFHTHKVRL